jgi:hypothetical protein
VGERGRHTRISNKARTVDGVNQTRMMQGRAKKEKSPMTDADFGEIGHQSRSKPATVSAKSATLCGLGWNSTELKLV